jgi:hypothetical protein
MSIFWLIVILGVGGGILQFVLNESKAREGLNVLRGRTNALLEHARSISNFTTKESIFGADGITGIAFDEARMTLCLLRTGTEGVTHRLIGYKDLMSAEIFQDGDSITKTVRSSQIGGAVVGGLLLGGVGVVVGGLSGKKRTTTTINQVVLRVVVNDTSAPLHDVLIFTGAAAKQSQLFSNAVTLGRKWHGILEVLIKRSEEAERSEGVGTSVPASVTSSVADEVQKLADLVQKGLLTVDEFKHQKARLLGFSPTQPTQPRLARAPPLSGPRKS